MAATIKDISRQTGLSLATISKYLNGGNVLEKNRALIDQAVAELDYTVNEAARSLKTKHSGYIGMLIPSLTNSFMMSMVNHVQAAVRAEGWGMSLCCLHSGSAPQRQEEEREATRFLMQKGIDGLINMPMNEDGIHLKEVLEAGIPVTLIDKNIVELAGRVSAVVIDNVGACRMLTDELLNAGHRRIAAVFDERNNYTVSRRHEGYRDACLQRGFEPDPSLCFFMDHQNAGEVREQLLARIRQHEVTAVLTGSESRLRYVLRLFREENIRIPEDVSLASIDGVPDFDLAEITSAVQPKEELARAAGELACASARAAIRGEEYLPQLRTMNAWLFRGRSIRPC
ncbi:MAG: LacI family DNA-binding transcriptional regulator [Butyrivibrio sp.]|nr:LacI family DNA-binding transcriptional regulator [Butyrivibrio sp.]